MKILLKLILGIIFLYVVLCLFVFFVQKNLIFFPSKQSYDLPKKGNLEEIYITTTDHIKLNAWYLDNHSSKTIIFFHGNGGNISYNQERLAMFDKLQVNAIMVDYRGYGKSEGEMNVEEDIYTDAEAAYQYITSKGTDPKNIIIWGQSLGGAIAIHLAQNKNVREVIAESTFYSMDAMAQKLYGFLPTSLLLKFHFRNDEKISNIQSPILVIHSKNDEMIPFYNGQELFEKVGNAKTFLETTGSHNGGFKESFDLYFSTIQRVIKD